MGLTAHAYIAEGGEAALGAVLELLQKEGIETRANPDVYVRAYAAFTIDDARSLREKASLRATGKRGRVFVISAPTIPPEAQNALLKTFEEPPAGAIFILIVPSPEMLLPTLRSRAQTLELDLQSGEDSLVDVKKFLAAAPQARLDMLKPLLEKDADENRNLSGTLAFLSSLEKNLAGNAGAEACGLRAVYRARKYITDRGSLMKPLLEQTALLIPRV